MRAEMWWRYIFGTLVLWSVVIVLCLLPCLWHLLKLASVLQGVEAIALLC